jgi:hypothetical protein
VHPDNYGSTFWTSPQADWQWPPPAEIDSAPFAAEHDAGALFLQGPSSKQLGVSVGKRFRGDPAGFIDVEYSILNSSARAVTYAPWEVSRVPSGGLTFYPTGHAPLAKSNLPVVEAAGVTWFSYPREGLGDHCKLFADGREGWIAHAHRRLLFVKSFDGFPAERQAPGEGEIEIYGNPEFPYVEVENQGPYTEIDVGESLAWKVRWRLARVPEEVGVFAGSEPLVRLVEQILG